MAILDDPTRVALVNSMTDGDFFWVKIVLTGGASIDVCHPYFKQGIFVPITAKETWTKAAKFKWYPLTRAVADQAHNQAIKNGTAVHFKNWDDLEDYKGFSQELATKKYSSTYGNKLSVVSGSHKSWLLSSGPHGVMKDGTPVKPPNDKKAINYGFYRTPRAGGGHGKYLDANWGVIQGPGGRHDAAHTDYSQLLQFMRNYKTSDGDGDLGAAILAGDPAVWDELPFKITKDVLPF